MGSVTDWDSKTVIGFKSRPTGTTRSESAVNEARRTGGVIESGKKNVANKVVSGPDHQKIAKLDRENEVAPPSTVSLALGKVIQKARQEFKDAQGNPKPLSQGDLAKAINQKPSVIQDYENSRATPNPQILGQMERVLKVKLRGKDIGQPLGPKKKK